MASSTGIVLEVGGTQLAGWTSAELRRDLRDVAGSFTISYFDKARIDAALGPQTTPFEIDALKAGMACNLRLEGTLLLVGYVDEVQVTWRGSRLEAHVSGRDKVGDLVDCAAAPKGPLEYRKLTALQIAQRLCAPFGITGSADIDVGAPFPVFGINPEETAMLAIERAARQRALLAVSDGVGGLLLTRGGSSRAPAPLLVGPGGNVVAAHAGDNWRERFSDYFVKGQSQSAAFRNTQVCTIVPGTDPATAPVPAPDASATTAETHAIAMTGHAIDPEVTRWRPTVNGVRTQSGSSSVQAQAEWALRVARGMSEQNSYRVLGWTANGSIWRPNALVHVTDPYGGVDKDMLIASVTFQVSHHGIATVLGVAGRTAFDRIDEPTGTGKILRSRRPVFGPTRKG